jgi:hypothetical protein
MPGWAGAGWVGSGQGGSQPAAELEGCRFAVAPWLKPVVCSSSCHLAGTYWAAPSSGIAMTAAVEGLVACPSDRTEQLVAAHTEGAHFHEQLRDYRGRCWNIAEPVHEQTEDTDHHPLETHIRLAPG